MVAGTGKPFRRSMLAEDKWSDANAVFGSAISFTSLLCLLLCQSNDSGIEIPEDSSQNTTSEVRDSDT